MNKYYDGLQSSTTLRMPFWFYWSWGVCVALGLVQIYISYERIVSKRVKGIIFYRNTYYKSIINQSLAMDGTDK